MQTRQQNSRHGTTLLSNLWILQLLTSGVAWASQLCRGSSRWNQVSLLLHISCPVCHLHFNWHHENWFYVLCAYNIKIPRGHEKPIQCWTVLMVRDHNSIPNVGVNNFHTPEKCNLFKRNLGITSCSDYKCLLSDLLFWALLPYSYSIF